MADAEHLVDGITILMKPQKLGTEGQTMGAMITNGTIFMQSQNGEWVKMREAAELPEFVETTGQNDVAFTIKPRTLSGTFTIDNRTRAKIRRMFMGFKRHPRMKNLMKAIRLAKQR